jgi:DNA-binding NtrC family response regulator
MTSEGDNSSAVLIVDEEPEILLLLSEILQKNGFRALLARTASEALDIARRPYLTVDLVLCNTRINQTITPDLLTALRDIRPRLRAVWMSAFVDAGIVRISLANTGANGAGPVDRGLITAIRAALRVREAGAGAAD